MAETRAAHTSAKARRAAAKQGARLGMASREMLSALMLVSRGLKNGSVKAKPVLTFKKGDVEMESLQEIVDAAIAKATGESV